MSVNHTLPNPTVPSPGAVLALFKPITWFPPVWAFGCGVVSAGVALGGRWDTVLLGAVLAGPLVCAMSQAANDWCDRHVDAINEPHRPIPSGRIPGRWGLWIALIWSVVSLVVAASLGQWAFWAGVVAVLAAWAYSAEPIRLKRSGWAGAGICALCYEGLPWFTGAAIMTGALPDSRILVIAALYSAGAVGIMILNDFKSVEGDRRTGVDSVPVMLGASRAARTACVLMLAPQIAVIGLLTLWDQTIHAGVVAALVVTQVMLVPRFLADPVDRAPWYNGTGTLLYVLGMLVSAFALGTITGGS
jgi:chlorophyll synthase